MYLGQKLLNSILALGFLGIVTTSGTAQAARIVNNSPVDDSTSISLNSLLEGVTGGNLIISTAIDILLKEASIRIDGATNLDASHFQNIQSLAIAIACADDVCNQKLASSNENDASVDTGVQTKQGKYPTTKAEIQAKVLQTFLRNPICAGKSELDLFGRIECADELKALDIGSGPTIIDTTWASYFALAYSGDAGGTLVIQKGVQNGVVRVPEASTIFGTVTAIGFGTFFKRKYFKKQKKEKAA